MYTVAGNCESWNAGTERTMMNAHAHIVKAHVVIGATVSPPV